ncbi:MAG TPA: hypothetical protein VMV86_00075, partial [Methanosarcinales archaeon]|nr:hypothetical protein [Methanosarcinales archaeon]
LQQAVKDGASTAEIGKIMSGATSGKSDSGKKDKGVLLDGIYYKSKQARKAVASIIARRKEKGEPEQKINKNSPSELLKDALLQKEAADKKRKITEEYENSIIMASQNTQLMAINKHKDYQEQYIQTERDFNMSMHAIHAQALAIRKQRAQAAAYNPAGMSIDDIAKKHKVVGGISNASSAVSGIASGAKKEPYSGITDYQSNQIMLGGLNKVQGVGGYSEETLKMGKSIHTAETVNLRLKNRNNAQMMAYLRQIGATQAETKAAEEALSGEIRSLKATKGVKIGNDNSVNVSDFN